MKIRTSPEVRKLVRERNRLIMKKGKTEIERKLLDASKVIDLGEPDPLSVNYQGNPKDDIYEVREVSTNAAKIVPKAGRWQ